MIAPKTIKIDYFYDLFLRCEVNKQMAEKDTTKNKSLFIRKI